MTWKLLTALASFGIVGITAQPMVAEATGMNPLTWFEQLGGVGVLAFLLWWGMSKTLPQMSSDHKEATKQLSDALQGDIRGLREDVGQHQERLAAQNDRLFDLLSQEKTNP